MPGRSRLIVSRSGRSSSRAQRQFRAYRSDANRLSAADTAARQGDFETAIRLYRKVALARPKTRYTQVATARLLLCNKLAIDRLNEIDGWLPGNDQVSSTSDVMRAASGDEAAVKWRAAVETAFAEYKRLADVCEELPKVKRQIKSHVTKQRKRMKYALVLNEADARQLLDVANDYQEKEHLCCALIAYQRAAQLGPSPSALIARDQLMHLQSQPDVVAAVITCTDLQWCHVAYRRAERLAKSKPERAKEIFAEIVDRAPADSEVYQAARKHVHDLRNAS